MVILTKLEVRKLDAIKTFKSVLCFLSPFTRKSSLESGTVNCVNVPGLLSGFLLMYWEFFTC